MSDVPPAKLCPNVDCTRKNPVKGNWCTAKECKYLAQLIVLNPSQQHHPTLRQWVKVIILSSERGS